MTKAVWNGKTLAESSETIIIEGNHYFPPDAIVKSYFQENDHHSTCPWKGEASYYDLSVDGKVNANAAWVYKEPKEAAKEIKGYIAFWKGVEVSQ
jgi:uncharacterized protein (DUF427 family)